MPSRIRYLLVGTGSRARMYADAIAGPHADVAELVACADTNAGRLDWHESRLTATRTPAPARFDVHLLESAIREHRADRVIVASLDVTHAGYVAEALGRCGQGGRARRRPRLTTAVRAR